jgi:hypothetical protein
MNIESVQPGEILQVFSDHIQAKEIKQVVSRWVKFQLLSRMIEKYATHTGTRNFESDRAIYYIKTVSTSVSDYYCLVLKVNVYVEFKKVSADMDITIQRSEERQLVPSTNYWKDLVSARFSIRQHITPSMLKVWKQHFKYVNFYNIPVTKRKGLEEYRKNKMLEPLFQNLYETFTLESDDSYMFGQIINKMEGRVTDDNVIEKQLKIWS